MTDQIDTRSVNKKTFIVRPVGGKPLAGEYSHQSGIVNFSPRESLQRNMTYEIVIPKGGIADVSGNAVDQSFASRFTTGDVISDFPVTAKATKPTMTGKQVTFKAQMEGHHGSALWSWDFGDGSKPTAFKAGQSTISHVFMEPGHYTVIARIKVGERLGAVGIAHTVQRPLVNGRATSSSTRCSIDGDRYGCHEGRETRCVADRFRPVRRHCER